MTEAEPLPWSEACERNKEPIFRRLKSCLPKQGTVLEIGSCTGQHVVYFAELFPALSWQPSDQSGCLQMLQQRMHAEPLKNILPPIELDVVQDWPAEKYAAVYSANTAHIMSWTAVSSMFEGIAQCLKPGGVFCLYGPFNQHGEFTSQSNQDFNAALRARDPEMGLRNLESLDLLASSHQMERIARYDMPANNQMLVYKK